MEDNTLCFHDGKIYFNSKSAHDLYAFHSYLINYNHSATVFPEVKIKHYNVSYLLLFKCEWFFFSCRLVDFITYNYFKQFNSL